jgi:hypothetical protein
MKRIPLFSYGTIVLGVVVGVLFWIYAGNTKSQTDWARSLSYSTCISSQDNRRLLRDQYDFFEGLTRSNPELTSRQKKQRIAIYEYLKRRYLQPIRCPKP